MDREFGDHHHQLLASPARPRPIRDTGARVPFHSQMFIFFRSLRNRSRANSDIGLYVVAATQNKIGLYSFVTVA